MSLVQSLGEQPTQRVDPISQHFVTNVALAASGLRTTNVGDDHWPLVGHCDVEALGKLGLGGGVEEPHGALSGCPVHLVLELLLAGGTLGPHLPCKKEEERGEGGRERERERERAVIRSRLGTESLVVVVVGGRALTDWGHSR